ncbi:M4 family metallopeptidase [Agromyces aurantiacus]|uniref:Neutral metalloproteinase n=1 Tax=Agromyces aurantiacus TaxID=165814 RepID=A0ABV9R8Z0_9MICO|nr:M4 family metallopeptidase [Agromyces aurantiacus]MBM7504411.1 Zn-dependent metalloprotease [Agromyces aurantiacus]
MTRMPPAAAAARERRPRAGIVPPWLLRRVAEATEHYDVAPEAARRSLRRDRPLRDLRAEAAHPPLVAHEEAREGRPSLEPSGEAEAPTIAVERPEPSPDRRISDAEHLETLPGRLVRREGEPETGDASVDEAYHGLGEVFALFHRVYGRDAIDGGGAPLEATVHFGDRYDNAFWDGERMVFGDGDGEVFRGFTQSLSVIGHELAHGVTEATARLRYRDQSGALNEHVSDVFGALVEQYAMGQDAGAATWLIGEGVFTDLVQGRALRSMLEPGTAYDDDVLGRDPQPAHFRDYVRTDDDNGGVHLNSGIPNRAFALAAVELGGFAWEHAGRVWYDTLTDGVLGPDDGFDVFAAATLAAARARFGAGSREARAISRGWRAVGLDPE